MKCLKALLRGRASPAQEQEPPTPLYTADQVQAYAERYAQAVLQQHVPHKFTPLLMETRCYVMTEENGVKVKKEAQCPGRE